MTSNETYTSATQLPCYPDPITTACGICARYNLDLCRLLPNGERYEYIDTRCPPIAANLFGSGANGFQIFEPTILLVCLVAGITGIVSGIRIYKNREARGHFEYAVTFVGFGVCMIITMITRCFLYPTKDASGNYTVETSGTVALVTVLIALSCCVATSLIFDALVDVAVIRDGCWLCIVIMAVTYLVTFILIISLAVTTRTNANTLEFFYFFFPLFSAGVYLILELINVLKRASKKGALWLSLCAVLFILACVCLTALHDTLCEKLSPFDGVFFYYLLLDLTFTVLYKYFVTIKEEELDDEETPMLCYC